LGFIRVPGKEHTEYHLFHSDLQSLINSSQAGCHLCILLLQTIPKDELKDFASGAQDFGVLKLKVWQPKWTSKTDSPVKRWKLGSVQKHCLVALVSPVFNNSQFIHKFVAVARAHGRERNLSFDPKEVPTSSIYGTSSMLGHVWTRGLTTKIFKGRILLRCAIHTKPNYVSTMAAILYTRWLTSGFRIALPIMISAASRHKTKLYLQG
jgi:hypothetical protein